MAPPPNARGITGPKPWAVLGCGIALDSCALLPVGFLGAFAVDLQSDLRVDSTFIGLAVAAFFFFGSLTALTIGTSIDAYGPRRVAVIAGATTAVANCVVGLSGYSPLMVVAASALAGAAFSLTMPATNAVLGAAVTAKYRTLAVCVKQSAVPAALIVATLAVPLLGGKGGWRAGYVLAAFVTVSVVPIFARCTRFVVPRSRLPVDGGEITGRQAQRAVARFGVATMLASLLPGALTGFAALSLVGAGSSIGAAVLVLAVANACGIAMRVVSGALAQHYRLTSWLPVSAMMVAGAVGAFLLSSGVLILTIVGTLLAFGIGWGWSGLTYALVLASAPGNPGSTGAVIQAGGMLGSACGPVLMALMAEWLGMSVGWIGIGIAILVAGIVVARGMEGAST
ncbi:MULTISPECIES: MFS transporter [Rhodococcus]|uniref:MFS transporter n=1 Tax=Rhodococcus TaxID=1827 RepID=UPI00071D3218|nr:MULTISPECIES: MFS transporter [Rhodococcus]ANQ75615.1 hypothetical protein AOT96_31845 [Rhodococcus sp. 008]KSU70602.1 hypothetical protein AS032_27035 [Rhodococcus qingshengii]SCC64181.1 Predicted arabinose efflux permease, MFS family [Rhodococcus qingshengii]